MFYGEIRKISILLVEKITLSGTMENVLICQTSKSLTKCHVQTVQIQIRLFVIPLSIVRNNCTKQNLSQKSMEQSVRNFRTFYCIVDIFKKLSTPIKHHQIMCREQ